MTNKPYTAWKSKRVPPRKVPAKIKPGVVLHYGKGNVGDGPSEAQEFTKEDYPAQYSIRESLDLVWKKVFPENITVRFRAIKPSDVDEMRRLFYRFPDKSVYYRYFSPIKTMPHALSRNCALDSAAENNWFSFFQIYLTATTYRKENGRFLKNETPVSKANNHEPNHQH